MAEFASKGVAGSGLGLGIAGTKTRTFKVYINVTAEISNTNFGLGKMFPRSK